MQPTRALLKHTPMIKFLGKRAKPSNIDHTPRVHPVSPSKDLPSSFASYRQSASQHGPLKTGSAKPPTPSDVPEASQQQRSPLSSSSSGSRGVGARSGRSLGRVEPKQGEFFDRDELPARFRRTAWDVREIEAVESGGASMW